MRFKFSFAALFLITGLIVAGLPHAPAEAQMIKPLDVEHDGNGVDLLSGKITPSAPVLSIPAAPNLRLQRLQDLLPILKGNLIPETWGNATYDINAGGSMSEGFNCDEQGDCYSRKKNGSHLIAIPQSGMVEYYEGGSGKLIYFDLRVGSQGPVVPGVEFVFYPSYIRYPSGEQINFSYDSYTDSNGQVHRRPSAISSIGTR